jgi:hypothetical protein
LVIDDLFREVEVQKIVKAWFESNGYVVVEKCVDNPIDVKDITKCKTSSVFGIDIVAKKANELWIVEVKGETKGGSASGDVDFMTGLGQLLTRMKKISVDIHYGIAIPYTKHFVPTLKKLRGSRAIEVLNLHLILVNQRDEVSVYRPSEFVEFVANL